jgi:hypothetical protein
MSLLWGRKEFSMKLRITLVVDKSVAADKSSNTRADLDMSFDMSEAEFVSSNEALAKLMSSLVQLKEEADKTSSEPAPSNTPAAVVEDDEDLVYNRIYAVLTKFAIPELDDPKAIHLVALDAVYRYKKDLVLDADWLGSVMDANFWYCVSIKDRRSLVDEINRIVGRPVESTLPTPTPSNTPAAVVEDDDDNPWI